MENFTHWLRDLSLNSLLPAAITLVVGMVVIRLITAALTRLLEKSKFEKAAHSLILSVAKTVMYVILVLMIVPKFGIEVGSLVALASVLTLAVSLSIQNLLTNVFSGFTLLYTKPFQSGDFVEIAGHSGSVREISLTYTKLLTADNKCVSIPNSAVTTSQIINYTAQGTRRVDLTVTASYDASLESVFAALRKAADVPEALPDPAVFVAVNNYGDSAIEYVLRVWTRSEDYWNVYFTVNKNIKAEFDAAGIEMTYPHLNVHLDQK